MEKLYNDVLQQAKIKDVLGYYGIAIHGNKCLCPFHDDTTPSMVINEKDNYVKCFACGEGGNPISFIYKYENKINHNPISYTQAIVKAVEICQLNINVEHLVEQQENEKYRVGKKQYSESDKELLQVYEKVNEYFTYDLFSQEKQSQEALAYLQKRGFDKELIKEMGLGFARTGFLSKLEASGNKGFDEITFTALGLKKDGLEVFRNRILFPIADAKGNIVAYGGRSIDANEQAKYLNTAETRLFQKSEILYNLNSAKNFAYQDQLYLVEGYMDVLGAKGMQMENVAALMGTSLSTTQMEMIKSVKCKVTLALDNDEAGKTATLKHIKTLQENDILVDVVDMNRLGEWKDFGDLHANGMKRIEIERSTISAFSYVMQEVYFQDAVFTTSTIFEVYQKAKEELWLTTTKDYHAYVDYICEHSDYERTQVEDILTPKVLEEKTAIEKYKDELLLQSLDSNMQTYLTQKKDAVLLSYFKENKATLLQQLIPILESNSNNYFNPTNHEINCAGLLYEVLHENEDYKQYEQIHRFHFGTIFDHCYYPKNESLGKVVLTQSQKDIIRLQFENTIPNDEKVLLDGIEDIYIVDSLNDLNKLLPDHLREGRKEYIKESMQVEGRMQYFNYGSILGKEQLPFLSNQYKTKDGNFKTILFFNNLEKSLVLTKDNFIVQEAVVDNHKEDRQQAQQKQEQPKPNIKVNISKPMKLMFDKADCVTIGNFHYLDLHEEEVPSCIKVNVKNVKPTANGLVLSTRSDFTYSVYRKDTIRLEKPMYLGVKNAKEIEECLEEKETPSFIQENIQDHQVKEVR